MASRYTTLPLFTFAVVFLFYYFPFPWSDVQDGKLYGHESKSCEPTTSRKSIWNDLSDDEVTQVIQYLHSPSAGLNLTHSPSISSWDNKILTVEALRPNKTDALKYLDHDGIEPRRFALANIHHGVSDQAEIQTYMVGPLPISPETKMEPLTYMYNSGRSSTVYTDGNPEGLVTWADEVATAIEDIALDLLGCRPSVVLYPQPGDEPLGDEQPNSSECLFNPANPAQIEHGRNMRWFGFSKLADSWALLPQALYIKADLTGRDPADWSLSHVFYNSKLYKDIDEFRKAWESPDFEKLPINANGNWTQLKPGLRNDENRRDAPFLVQSGKSRVAVNRNESFVSWLGFDFNIAFSQVTGMSLFDIRVDGERVIYELGMQEALAEYAGNDPKLSGTAYMDTAYNFGALATELVPGYDCPIYAEYLDTQHALGEKIIKHKGTICVFETPLDFPLQRHSGITHTTTFANSALVVRSISTVGNYDYTTEYIFYLDGSIEVKLRASGYIQGAYWKNNTQYGYQVHDFVSSAIHDHTINFKADMDVAGAKNTIEIVTLSEKEIEYPWAPDVKRRTMSLEKSISPDESFFDWPRNGAAMYLVSNQNAKNAYGENRAYRIVPGTGIASPVHLTTHQSSNLRNATTWAEHDLYVTKQKDTEPRSSSPLNGMTPDQPLIQFDRFLDGENVVDEDL